MINRFFLYCLLFLSLSPLYGEGKNLILNPGMELSNDIYTYWNHGAYNKIASRFIVESGHAHTGSNFVSIISDSPNDAQLIQNITVESYKNYKVSGYIRTENVGKDNIGANISVLNHMFVSKQIKGTSGKWEYVVFYIAVQENVSKVDLGLRLGGYGSLNTGKASFDDISFEETGKIPKGADWIFLGDKTRTSSENADTKAEKNKSFGEKKGIIIKTEDLPHILVVFLIILSAGFFIFLLFVKEAGKKGKK